MNELQTKIAAKEFIKQKFRARATIKALEPELGQNYAGVKGHRMINSDKFIQSVEEELEAHGITSEELDKELKSIYKQNKQLAPKLGAIAEANKLKRRYPKEETKHLHLHGNPDELISNLLKRYEEIKKLAPELPQDTQTTQEAI